LLNKFTELRTLSLLGEVSTATQYALKPLDICKAINHMDSLKRLDLLVANMFSWTTTDVTSSSKRITKLPLHLSRVLPRLDHFSLHGLVDNLTEVLGALGPCCKTLRLDRNQMSVADWMVVHRRNPQLAINVKELQIC